VSAKNARGFSTSKYLIPEEDKDDEQFSNYSEVFKDEDNPKFWKLYNIQGHYSATQSVRHVFSRCCSMKCARNFVKMVAYLVSASIFVFMYLSIADAYAEELPGYSNSNSF